MIDIIKYEEEMQNIVNNFYGDKDKLAGILKGISEAILDKKYSKLDRLNMANEALNIIFKNAYSQDPIMPISFLETEVAKAIMHCKYQVPGVYSVKEVANLVGSTVQQVYSDKNKKIKPIEKDLNFFYEDEVVKYLENKGIPVGNMYK